MAEWVIDTNVLIVATMAQQGRPPAGCDDVPVASAQDQEAVFTWLETVNRDPNIHVIIDFPHRLIEGEYSNKIQKHEYGRMVIANKISRGQCRFVEVEKDDGGYGLILHDCAEEVFDREDRKMVAAALEAGVPIVNACDTDWVELLERGTLGRLDIKVHQLLEAWCRKEWERKRAKQSGLP